MDPWDRFAAACVRVHTLLMLDAGRCQPIIFHSLYVKLMAYLAGHGAVFGGHRRQYEYYS